MINVGALNLILWLDMVCNAKPNLHLKGQKKSEPLARFFCPSWV
jgi:hypothetical protein